MKYLLRPILAIGVLIFAVFLSPLARHVSISDLYHEFTAEWHLGIDLGTTFSVAAICVRGEVSIVQVDGEELTPSVVYFPEIKSTDQLGKQRSAMVGQSAKAMRKTKPLLTVHGAKRVIGKRYSEVMNTVGESDIDLAIDESKLKSARDFDFDFAGIIIGNEKDRKVISPEIVAAHILAKLKEFSEKSEQLPWIKRVLGFSFPAAIISIPVSFSYEQKQATIRAGELAGFKSVLLIEEPVAAAMAYGLHEAVDGIDASSTAKAHYVLVFDIGGGTLDVALLFLEPRTKNFFVDSTAGISRLGGEDFDFVVADALLDAIAERKGFEEAKNIRQNNFRWSSLMQVAEQVKLELSEDILVGVCVTDESFFVVPRVKQDVFSDHLCKNRHPTAYLVQLSLERFEEKARDLLVKMLEPVAEVLNDAGMDRYAEIDVVMVGGSSRIPRIRTELQDYLPNARLHYEEVDPDKAVAIGAARSRGCTFR